MCASFFYSKTEVKWKNQRSAVIIPNAYTMHLIKQCTKKGTHIHSGRDTITAVTTTTNGCRKKCVWVLRTSTCFWTFLTDVYLRIYHMNLFAVFQKPQNKMTKLPECEWFCLLALYLSIFFTTIHVLFSLIFLLIWILLFARAFMHFILYLCAGISFVHWFWFVWTLFLSILSSPSIQ